MNGARFKSKKFIPLAGAIVCACAFALWAFLAVLPATASATAPSTTLSPQANDLATTSLTTQADSNTNWGLESIYATEAQDYVAAHTVSPDKPVCVAILDTGFYNHSDFSGKVVARWNAAAEMPSAKQIYVRGKFVKWDITVPFETLESSENTTPSAIRPSESGGDLNHGTHVAGIVHAVAPDAKLILIKVADADGVISTGALYNAFALVKRYQETYNIRVVNFSGGKSLNPWPNHDVPANEKSGWESFIYDQIDEALEAGVVTVCSAGNDGTTGLNYPSDYPAVVSVMGLAMKKGDPFTVELDAKSNRNPNNATKENATKDICAPGKEIVSSIGEGSERGTMSGTSMAAPHVSGVLALMFAVHPTFSAENAISQLYKTATKLGNSDWDAAYGYGEVNAEAAVAVRSIKGIHKAPITPVGTTEAGKYYAQYSITNAGFDEDWDWKVVSGSATVTKVDKKTCKLFSTEAGTVTLQAKSGDITLKKSVEFAPVSFSDAYYNSNDEIEPAAGDYPARLFVGFSDPSYTGSPLKPLNMAVSIGASKDTATLLKEGVDYKTVCTQNTNAGTNSAHITVMGIGNYSGSRQFEFSIKRTSIKDTVITISPTSVVYSGMQQKPQVTVGYAGKTLIEGTDYELQYQDNVSVGTGKVTIKGLGNFTGVIPKSFTIVSATVDSKAKDPATVNVLKKTIKIKYKNVKKKKQTAACPVAVSNARGAVSYKIHSINKKAGKKKITINAKTGKITVKKGCKKGTYKVKIRVNIARSRSYDAATHIIPITIRVK